jgi:hypothetical protein
MRRFIKIALALFVAVLLLITSMGIALWYIWSSNLPYIGSLKDYNPPIITEVFANDGQIIGQFWDEMHLSAQRTTDSFNTRVSTSQVSLGHFSRISRRAGLNREEALLHSKSPNHFF